MTARVFLASLVVAAGLIIQGFIWYQVGKADGEASSRSYMIVQQAYNDGLKSCGEEE